MNPDLDAPAVPVHPGQAGDMGLPSDVLPLGRSTMLTVLILSLLCLILRIHTKAFVVRHFQLSDYAMCLAWGVWIGFVVNAWMLGNVSAPLDLWKIPIEDLVTVLYHFYVAFMLYGVCICFIKLSILFQLLELFSTKRDRFFWSCHGLIWVNFLFYATTTFLGVFSCHPRAKAWDVRITDGSCAVDTNILGIIMSCINAASNLVILVLPQIYIWRLHATLRQRLQVSAAFSFGFLATTASIIRLVYAILTVKRAYNLTYYAFWAGFWAILEIGFGILAGCLPTSIRFFRNFRRNAFVKKFESSWARLTPTASASSSRPRGVSTGRRGSPAWGMGLQVQVLTEVEITRTVTVKDHPDRDRSLRPVVGSPTFLETSSSTSRLSAYSVNITPSPEG